MQVDFRQYFLQIQWGELHARVARAPEVSERETALLSYSNNCKDWHSGDGVILLVVDDAQLPATSISDMGGKFELTFFYS